MKKVLVATSITTISILTIGILTLMPLEEADAALGPNQICIDKVWIESTKGKIACVTPSTAEKLVERGWGTLLEEIPMEKPMEEKPLPAIPTITKAGTIVKATLYDDGATNTWNIVAVSIGDLLDFSEESAQEHGLGAVYGVFNGSHSWITGQHETFNQRLKDHENVKDFQAHTHLVSLRNTSDCTFGFAYEKIFSTETDNASIVFDQIEDSSTIEFMGIPANMDVGDIVDKSLVCHNEDNGKDVGEYYVWEFYKGNNGALCLDFDTARSQDKLISQDAETGGFVCP